MRSMGSMILMAALGMLLMPAAGVAESAEGARPPDRPAEVAPPPPPPDQPAPPGSEMRYGQSWRQKQGMGPGMRQGRRDRGAGFRQSRRGASAEYPRGWGESRRGPGMRSQRGTRSGRGAAMGERPRRGIDRARNAVGGRRGVCFRDGGPPMASPGRGMAFGPDSRSRGRMGPGLRRGAGRGQAGPGMGRAGDRRQGAWFGPPMRPQQSWMRGPHDRQGDAGWRRGLDNRGQRERAGRRFSGDHQQAREDVVFQIEELRTRLEQLERNLNAEWR